jgi:hypothetical protein
MVVQLLPPLVLPMQSLQQHENIKHLHSPVGASHSAIGAIESALKNVSPDTHWIARRLATAGSKRIKMRLLGNSVCVFLGVWFCMMRTFTFGQCVINEWRTAFQA